MLPLLIRFGWDLDVTSRYDTDKTVLHRAASRGDIAAIILLLDHGASVEGARKNGNNIVRETSLMVANEATTTRLLLSRGAKVDARDRFGKTALFRAKTFEIASLLVEHGADVNVRDNNGDTPLTEHCKYSLHGRLDPVSLLLDNGADVRRLPPDEWFLAPLHAATIHLATDLVIRLLPGGAPPDC
ncbi:ankyrin [Gonapodya prolifera JEL478]|uniref:Ankyrin n=1 Tax=Gonapodya prolifera (strain JEL478) TaxID=1344416 RepID=A0A139A5R3_GONPJ|nr:ankyrin [Gonapodya prolifera JEL478]|eukprot:KXS12081.1 ankyrin [Gonapodya prolifera JEL478]